MIGEHRRCHIHIKYNSCMYFVGEHELEFGRVSGDKYKEIEMLCH